jgi:PBSX family phage terminase large subunit
LSLLSIETEARARARSMALAARAGATSKGHQVVIPRRSYTPYGAAGDLWRFRDPQIIISGPAETGKTLACLHLLDSLAWKYPAMQAVIIRKTYKSMPGSVLQTYEKKILSPGDGVTKFGGEKPEWFDYPNGSRVWVGGMDNPQKVLSSERDLVYVNQAEELSLGEWETLTSRITGRAGHMSEARIIGDCNPGPSNHWIKASADEGKLKLLESRHEDNPTLFNPKTGEITEQGRRTLAVLDGLTGVRYLRLRQGLWAAAEGVVYDGFDRGLHLKAELPVKPQRHVAGVDWGFTNAGVLQVWGVDGDKRMYRVREVYRTKKTIDWWIEEAKKLKAEFACVFVCDPSQPGYIQQFKNAGLRVVEAFNDISLGIQNVQQRLKPAEDGQPRIYWIVGGLAGRDEELSTLHKPTCSEEEIEAYVWPQGVDGKALKELPIDDNNHGMDAMRYAAAYVDGLARASQPLGVLALGSFKLRDVPGLRLA